MHHCSVHWCIYLLEGLDYFHWKCSSLKTRQNEKLIILFYPIQIGPNCSFEFVPHDFGGVAFWLETIIWSGVNERERVRVRARARANSHGVQGYNLVCGAVCCNAWCMYMFVHVYVCLPVHVMSSGELLSCVCVWLRVTEIKIERERESRRKRGTERVREQASERKRERERARARARFARLWEKARARERLGHRVSERGRQGGGFCLCMQIA